MIIIINSALFLYSTAFSYTAFLMASYRNFIAILYGIWIRFLNINFYFLTSLFTVQEKHFASIFSEKCHEMSNIYWHLFNACLHAAVFPSSYHFYEQNFDMPIYTSINRSQCHVISINRPSSRDPHRINTNSTSMLSKLVVTQMKLLYINNCVTWPGMTYD